MRGVLISTDPTFRETLRSALTEAQQGVQLALEIAVPFADISAVEIQALRTCDPELVFLDLDPDPATGINLAHYLADGEPRRRVLACGSALSSELLLEAMRAGVTEYLPKPVAIESMAAAVDRAARRLGSGQSGSPQAGKLYAVFSPKGGAGTTTLATNLAIVLHGLTGKKTLLLDLNLELGETALLLGIHPRFHFVDMVRNFERMDAGLLASFIERHESGVHLLSAPLHPERAEVATGEQVRAILQFLKQHYDFIVIDTSKSFSPATVAALDEADLIFAVITADIPSLRNLQRCLPLLEQGAGSEERRLRLDVNRYDPNDVISLADVRQAAGLEVYGTLSNDFEAVSRSINTAHPIARNGSSRYGRDLQALGADIAKMRRRTDTAPRTAPRPGLLARVWGWLRRRHEEVRA